MATLNELMQQRDKVIGTFVSCIDRMVSNQLQTTSMGIPGEARMRAAIKAKLAEMGIEVEITYVPNYGGRPYWSMQIVGNPPAEFYELGFNYQEFLRKNGIGS